MKERVFAAAIHIRVELQSDINLAILPLQQATIRIQSD